MTGKAGRKSFWQGLLLSEYFVLYLSLAYFLVLLPFIPVLATPQNLTNLFSNLWPLLAVAVGQTFVLIVAGIDLSQTAVIALSSVVAASLITQGLNPTLFEKSRLWGWFYGPGGGPLGHSPVGGAVGVAAMLAAGGLVGGLNGWAVTRLRMPPFMVTLISMTFFSAAAIWLTKSENVIDLPPGYLALGQGPWPLLISGGLALLAHTILRHSLLGRWMYAAGSNPKAARASGVSVERAVLAAYALSGLYVAVGSLLYSAWLEMGRPTLGSNLLLDVIIGGTSLFGGRGGVGGTVLGALMLQMVTAGLVFTQVGLYLQPMVFAAILFLDSARTALLERRRIRTLRSTPPTRPYSEGRHG